MNLLVLHDYGSPRGGARWRQALAEWPGDAAAPDLPGHGTAPAPPGGWQEPSDVAMAAAITLADLGWTEPPAVVAIGASATGGELLALGSRASMLFLVDGLGGRWPASAEETIAAEAAYARRLADDPAAVGPAPAEGVDPRPRHGFTPRTDRAFVERLRRQIPVPVVVIETPASVTHPSEVEERAAMFDPPAAVIELDDSEPGAVLAAVVSHLVR